jgi:hypothetical protein
MVTGHSRCILRSLKINNEYMKVNEKMVYSSTIFRVKEVLGITLFGEDRRFGEVVRNFICLF